MPVESNERCEVKYYHHSYMRCAQRYKGGLEIVRLHGLPGVGSSPEGGDEKYKGNGARRGISLGSISLKEGARLMSRGRDRATSEARESTLQL